MFFYQTFYILDELAPNTSLDFTFANNQEVLVKNIFNVHIKEIIIMKLRGNESRRFLQILSFQKTESLT